MHALVCQTNSLSHLTLVGSLFTIIIFTASFMITSNTFDAYIGEISLSEKHQKGEEKEDQPSATASCTPPSDSINSFILFSDVDDQKEKKDSLR